jgi:hypothetical protein
MSVTDQEHLQSHLFEAANTQFTGKEKVQK